MLVDAARARGAGKRGLGFVRVTLDEAILPKAGDADVLPLDDALTALAVVDPSGSTQLHPLPGPS